MPRAWTLAVLEDRAGPQSGLSAQESAGRSVEEQLPAGWLTQRAERELVRRVQTGTRGDRDRAFEDLVRAFGPLLRAAVRRVEREGLDSEELSQVARLAFLRAVERFDLDQTWRLASYARPWVDGVLRREAASQGVLIRV